MSSGREVQTGKSEAGTNTPGGSPRSSHDRLVRKLREALGRAICDALDDPSVVELMLNPDGRLFVERLGQGVLPLANLESGAAEIIIGSVAHALPD